MSHQLKIIANNTLAQLIAKFFGAGLTLLTTYYTIRLSGIDLYGDLTKILVMVAVGFTAIDFGLNAEGIRSSSNQGELKKNVGSIILARLLLSFLAVIVLNLLIQFLPGGYSNAIKNVFWLASLAIIFQGIYTSSNAYFQYQLSYWRSTISVVVGSLIGTLLTLYYLKYSPTLPNLILANTIGYFVMAICSLILLPKPLAISYKPLAIIALLRRSLILGAILIASVLASKIDTVILGVFRSSSEVGEYGFAYRIFDVILVLPVFIMNTIYPLMLQSKKSLLRPTLYALAGLGIFVAISLWILAPFVYLVRPGLTLTSNVLRLLSISLPFFYLTAPLMWALIAQKRDKLVLLTYLMAALLNASLNLSLIPHYGATATAINTGFTELFIFVSLLYCSRNPIIHYS